MTNQDSHELGTRSIPGLLASKATPMIIALVLNGMYFLVDAVFVGWGVGPNGLGGLAVVFPLQMLAIAVGTMLGVGGGNILSLELGRDNEPQAIRAIKAAFVLAVVFGLIFPICLTVFKDTVIQMTGATESIFSHAEAYYRYIVWGFFFIFLSMVEIHALRAEGKAKIAAAGLVASSLLNAVLDPLFILGLNMGTAGAAVATIIARILVTVYLTSFYLKGRSKLEVTKGSWLPDPEMIKKVLALGSGVFFNQISFSILAIIMNLSLRHYGGTLSISVYGIISRIYIFITLPFMGLAQGFQPIVGYNLGAGKQSRIKEAIQVAVIFSILLGAIPFILFEACPGMVLGLFTKSADVVQNGITPLRITMMMTPIAGIQILSYFFFLAIGESSKAIFLSVSRQLIFLVPFILLLPLFLGVLGIWVAYPIADVISVAISYLLLASRKNRMLSRVQ